MFFVSYQLVYGINNFVIDKSIIPSYVPSGMIKAEMMIDLDGEIVGGFDLYARVENDAAI